MQKPIEKKNFLKTFWGKEKMMLTTIVSFSHYISFILFYFIYLFI